MRKVDRNKVSEPGILKSPFTTNPKVSELERSKLYYVDQQGKKPSFKRYKEPAVKAALRELFHGKCAYCEGYFENIHPVDVEHYRPKGSVSNSEHEGYWWLAADWENLLPSCIDCNRNRKQEILDVSNFNTETLYGEDYLKDLDKEGKLKMGKKDSFPLMDGSPYAQFDADPDEQKKSLNKEQRLLLDPTRDVPDDHISFYMHEQMDVSNQKKEIWSIVLPVYREGKVSKKGLTSSLIYGLNRLGLVKSRSQLLIELEFLWEMSIQLKRLVGKVNPEKIPDEDLRGSLTRTLVSLDKKIIQTLHDKMQDDAPYCSMVRVWYKGKLA